MGRRLTALSLAFAAIGCTPDRGAPSVTPAPSASAAPAKPHRHVAILDALANALSAHYVFPDVATQIVAAIRAHDAKGEYEALDGGALADALTNDLRETNHDLHLRVEFRAHHEGPRPDEPHGITAVERLPGNVARIALASLDLVGEMRAPLGKAMDAVADADALIIDLRDNYGGDPDTVAVFVSYFFDAAPPVHVNDMYWHDSGETEQFWTSASLDGKRFGPKKRVYVLVNGETFSAGEELAYDLQALKRATIVGAHSKGGAHPVWIGALGEEFEARVPTGRAINPITKSNWEGTGVMPDVACDPKDAVETARKLAIAK